MRALCAAEPGPGVLAYVDGQTAGYVGTVPLFEAHGFSRVCPTSAHSDRKPRWLVRRELGPGI
jgi:hypothetical protein